ncbi:hypothetical protein P0W64_21150 [Tsukamurella sp. 8F]|uniref:hypothetical protein n=1 Tax=unclassified Tsukamurella TaxID=2633480 RepID=UPI0023B8ADA7|nr:MULTISPECIES: hypothetical protein [unclassified Tsukamurella]MDF0532265.1 hypothetical protein [Tsukamurella sp. 8J]MDF0589291.1 hypothetical protein [Tsukamurella sp. 8F]
MTRHTIDADVEAVVGEEDLEPGGPDDAQPPRRLGDDFDSEMAAALPPRCARVRLPFVVAGALGCAVAVGVSAAVAASVVGSGLPMLWTAGLCAAMAAAGFVLVVSLIVADIRVAPWMTTILIGTVVAVAVTMVAAILVTNRSGGAALAGFGMLMAGDVWALIVSWIAASCLRQWWLR